LNNDWTPNRPDMLLMGLVEQIQAAQDPSVRFNSTLSTVRDAF